MQSYKVQLIDFNNVLVHFEMNIAKKIINTYYKSSCNC